MLRVEFFISLYFVNFSVLRVGDNRDAQLLIYLISFILICFETRYEHAFENFIQPQVNIQQQLQVVNFIPDNYESTSNMFGRSEIQEI